MSESDIVERLQKATLYAGHGELSDLPEEAADIITALRAENERLSKDYQTARDAHDRMLAENFSLSAWQCVYIDGKIGLIGDEHGNQYCAMSKRADALRAKVERLEEAVKDLTAECREYCFDECQSNCEPMTACRLFIARAALGDTHE